MDWLALTEPGDHVRNVLVLVEGGHGLAEGTAGKHDGEGGPAGEEGGHHSPHHHRHPAVSQYTDSQPNNLINYNIKCLINERKANMSQRCIIVPKTINLECC